MANLIGRETLSTITNNSQVYLATHDGAGNSLPYMSRSFISFTFGGKVIEDFNLIVVNGSDMLSKPLYASFEDNVTNNSVLDGQYYWGTHFNANNLQLTLATDGITQNQLDDFKRWFRPGIERELILSEHPNRAIFARVAEPPAMEMLPFEKQISHTIDNIIYNTSTTIYKGNITLNFIMDEPTWYAKLTYMPSYVNKDTLERLPPEDLNPKKIETIQDKDMIKIMVEDNLPHQSMLQQELFLGGNLLVTSEARTDFSKTDNTNEASAYLGRITTTSQGLIVNVNAPKYLFYSGTARSYPTIKFSLKPNISSDNYINVPKNTIQNTGLTEYSQIILQIGNDITTKKIFSFTTPSILTGYNQAIKILKNSVNKSVTQVISEIRDQIKEKYSRAWAVACANIYGSTVVLNNNYINNLINKMKSFIDTNSVMTFIINSKTGAATGKFFVKVLEGPSDSIDKSIFTEVEENVGDMIRSDYLFLDERNYLNSNGEIVLGNCYKITSNESLTNVLFLYEDMYL